MPRADKLDVGFLLCFTINSKPLPGQVTAFLAQTCMSHSAERPFPRGSVQLCVTPDP